MIVASQASARPTADPQVPAEAAQAAARPHEQRRGPHKDCKSEDSLKALKEPIKGGPGGPLKTEGAGDLAVASGTREAAAGAPKEGAFYVRSSDWMEALTG
ncbi:hypothetical protein Emag_000262 [Eimeria magna]